MGAGLAKELQLNHKMAAANLGYNVLLEAIEPKLRAANTFEAFKAVYAWLGTVQDLPLSRKQEAFLAELGIEDTAPVSETKKFSDDPTGLLPEISIAKGGLSNVFKREDTFLGQIHKRGGKVDIGREAVLRMSQELGIQWAAQHEGGSQGLTWLAQIGQQR